MIDVQQRPRAGQADRVSEAIRLSRLICILGVVYVHAWTGLDGAALAAAAGTPQDMLRFALVEMFGRSAVPLLSMIAGWLVVGSVGRRPYGTFLADKARTILAPMALWNALAIVLVSGAAWLGWVRAPLPTTWRWTLNELFSLATPNDINVQTPFLRDLFVCMAVAPLLARLPRWSLAAAAAAALAWTLSGATFPLLLRPAILLFFILGMAIRRTAWETRIAATPLIVAAAPYAGFAALRFWLEVSGGERLLPGPAAASLDLLVRLAAAAFVWAAAWRLTRTAAARPLQRLEPYVFLTFCSHLIFMWLAGPLIGQLTGPLGAPLYPLFLLLQPVLALAATIALGQALARFAPRAGWVLSGGRIGVRRAGGDGRPRPKEAPGVELDLQPTSPE